VLVTYWCIHVCAAGAHEYKATHGTGFTTGTGSYGSTSQPLTGSTGYDTIGVQQTKHQSIGQRIKEVFPALPSTR